jgi:hypothetical protein
MATLSAQENLSEARPTARLQTRWNGTPPQRSRSLRRRRPAGAGQITPVDSDRVRWVNSREHFPGSIPVSVKDYSQNFNNCSVHAAENSLDDIEELGGCRQGNQLDDGTCGLSSDCLIEPIQPVSQYR